MAWPETGAAPFPAVLVIHENRGLNPYVEDVVRRFAAAGFLALGPDALTSLGGYPGTDEEGRDMQRSLDGAKVFEDFVAGANFLMRHTDSTGKVGAVGFCFGGGVVNRLAVRLPDLGAGAPFYGSQPGAEDVARINAPLLIHYAGLDTRINSGWEAYEAALKANGKTYTMHMYEGDEPRLPQRHDAALRRGGRQAGPGPHDRILPEAPRLAPSEEGAAHRRRCAGRWAVTRHITSSAANP